MCENKDPYDSKFRYCPHCDQQRTTVEIRRIQKQNINSNSPSSLSVYMNTTLSLFFLNTFTPQGFSEKGPFCVFQSRYCHKYVSYEDHLFFQNIWNLIADSKNAIKKQQKVCFFFQITAFEVVAVNSPYYDVTYTSFGVGVLTSSPQMTKNDFF